MDIKLTPEQRREYTERVREETTKAREEAGERGDEMRSQVGDRLLDVMAENFPEEYESRRRAAMLKGFGVGVAVGLLGREALRMRRSE
ncbi:hypothetical protein [Candidatus Halobonum tyrrellensis]|uniref:Uncharacterized protein n=1 Tax=Candidatus Halobonum tyrrellensis G22 TaxID=1324957 RepID=V4HC84_9EURY|nr:hypothetical protein [Candidatus Halobonum tyrrellensis]ESP87673.1 hypothetical protein K933_12670 [Candidatus Halobonum tyrrellensis G22]